MIVVILCGSVNSNVELIINLVFLHVEMLMEFLLVLVSNKSTPYGLARNVDSTPLTAS